MGDMSRRRRRIEAVQFHANLFDADGLEIVCQSLPIRIVEVGGQSFPQVGGLAHIEIPGAIAKER